MQVGDEAWMTLEASGWRSRALKAEAKLAALSRPTAAPDVAGVEDLAERLFTEITLYGASKSLIETYLTRAALSAPLPAATREEEKLARFGHHPDAAIDYECEIDALIGMAYDRLTMGMHPDLEDRIRRAMTFRALSTPGELRWLNQTFCGAREIYAVKPAWVQWPEDKLAALPVTPAAPAQDGAK